MRLIRGIYNLKNEYRKCVLTIGNFDGVHLGHQMLLKRLCIEGSNYNVKTMVILFEPHPLEVLKPFTPFIRITSFREKIKYLSTLGIDLVLCIRFKLDFASLNGEFFIKNFLINNLSIKLLIVGDDFCLGVKRHCDVKHLKKLGLKYGFNVININTYLYNKIRISSSLIRKYLYVNNFDFVKLLLGRSFMISGRVVKGNAIGCNVIGYPTANISIRHTTFPLRGVYAVKIYGLFLEPIYGIANIGTCPTFYGTKLKMEVHLLDIFINLYYYRIDVLFCCKIRDEKFFYSIDKLKKQISNDIMVVKKYFKLKI
ncbi:bifunctional riboflavin kinase/FAD synthetase [Candidatus Purcelliella pentastirinorum]|nr:bifunctional riboflavin kinase/FAD synthetase [Candidatus Purcelliella pentastirinorum]WDI79028.1 bifunctional riboflavin kinase/FAD synthetase [Candidatus Purcelliella pentastirinorum]WDR80166.1 bifunctional riboflavin kinase/FAD synthetase [Candidatus Purcelliella pentastirinorum]